ncbi:ALP1-like protein isoform X1 [Tanacetum coccineum]
MTLCPKLSNPSTVVIVSAKQCEIQRLLMSVVCIRRSHVGADTYIELDQNLQHLRVKERERVRFKRKDGGEDEGVTFCDRGEGDSVKEYLRKPAMTDVVKLYRHHEEKHMFLEMLGRLDCTDGEWFGCPYAYKGKYIRRDHRLSPFILLEAIASQDLWTRNALFGVSWSNNNINVIHQSPLFTDLKTKKALEISFVANDEIEVRGEKNAAGGGKVSQERTGGLEQTVARGEKLVGG